jgi:hypothetical protein
VAIELKFGQSSDIAEGFPTSKSIKVTNVSSDGIEGFQSLPITIVTNNVSAVNDDLISSIDVSQYKFISLELTGTWAGTVSFSGSNSGGTFYPIVTSNPSGSEALGETSTTVNRLVKLPTVYKFVRVRVTAYTSGIVEGIAYGHRDENSSGLVAQIGPVSLNAETTKKIGNVGIVTDTELSDYYVSVVGLNERMIRAQACTLKAAVLTNLTATPRYVRLYDTATTPTAGSGTPELVLTLPAAGTLAFPLSLSGYAFANGIGMTLTLGPANNNTTPATTTPDVVLMTVFT